VTVKATEREEEIMADLTGTPDDDILIGTDGEENTLIGLGGDDEFTGGNDSPSNRLYGDTQFTLSDDSTGGHDILTGGDNSTNTLHGGAWQMPLYRDNSLAPLGGDDTLTGGGAGGTNTLYGDAFEMSLNTTGGDARLISGEGTDAMWGDAAIMPDNAIGGSDTFVFGVDNGDDTIHDFNQGEDLIEMNGFTTLIAPIPAAALAQLPSQALSHVYQPYSFSDLQIEEENGDSIIHLDADNSVTVVDVLGLTGADFDFIA
jgi:hypothetical protein